MFMHRRIGHFGENIFLENCLHIFLCPTDAKIVQYDTHIHPLVALVKRGDSTHARPSIEIFVLYLVKSMKSLLPLDKEGKGK